MTVTANAGNIFVVNSFSSLSLYLSTPFVIYVSV